MSKAIIKSESPKRCEQIARGKCTMLLSKTKPKLETPFKCYIYKTKKPVAVMFSGTGKHISEYDKTYCYNSDSGKVIGSFVCDKVIQVKNDSKYSTAFGGFDIRWNIDTEKTGLTDEQLNAYCGEPIDFVHPDNVSTAIFKTWALYISQVKIYDTPKELEEFYSTGHCFNLHNVKCTENVWGDYVFHYSENSLCRACKYLNDLGGCEKRRHALTQPPRSWCYVEEI